MTKYLPRIIAIVLIQTIIITCMCLDEVFMVLMLVIYGIIAFFYLVGAAVNNSFNFRTWDSSDW